MPEVTQDSQGPTGSQEAGVNQETRAPQASPARRSEMKVIDSWYQTCVPPMFTQSPGPFLPLKAARARVPQDPWGAVPLRR